MICTELTVRVMVFYRINILHETIDDALQKLLPEYSLSVSIAESIDQLFDAIDDNQVDIVIVDFSHLFNHRSGECKPVTD